MKNNYWKQINAAYWENLIPVREKSSGTVYDTATVRIRKEQEDLFEAVDE